MDKSQMVNELIAHYSNGNKSQFASLLGIRPQTINSWISRDTFDTELIYAKCVGVSADWLLTGEGDMLKEQREKPAAISATPKHLSTGGGSESSVAALPEVFRNTPGAIPLVSEKAVGGFYNDHLNIKEHDVLAYYVIPKFRHLAVDFMIEVFGDSMMPHLYPGDIIACSIIHTPQFIQWNKPHLIATREQGLIVKRLRKSSMKDCLLAVSDNKDYDPFDIPKSEIMGMARIVGVIHIE